MCRVMPVVAAQLDSGPSPHCLTRSLWQLEAHEVHRRGLLSVFAVQVFVSDGVDPRPTFDLDKQPVFDADQPPISRASSRLRSCGSGYSISIVAFQLPPSGTSAA